MSKKADFSLAQRAVGYVRELSWSEGNHTGDPSSEEAEVTGCSTPLRVWGSCQSPSHNNRILHLFPTWWAQGEGLCSGKKRESSEAGLRGEARTGHTPRASVPSPSPSRLHRPPSSSFPFLERIALFSQHQESKYLGVPYVSLSPPALPRHRGCLCAARKGGEHGPPPLGTLPIVGGLAGMGHRPKR